VTLASVPPADAADLPTARSGAQAAAAAPAPLPSETRAQQFDRLARGTPAEALEALKLLAPCYQANMAKMELGTGPMEGDDPDWRQKRKAEVVTAAKEGDAGCMTLTGGQLSQGVELALKAARAGVPGGFDAVAAQENVTSYASGKDFTKEDLRDPRLIEALPAITQAYANAGDPHALLALSTHEDPMSCAATSTCDPYLSLVHWTAYVDTAASQTVAAHGDAVTPRLAQSLTPDQAQAAIAQGHALYANRGTK